MPWRSHSPVKLLYKTKRNVVNKSSYIPKLKNKTLNFLEAAMAWQSPVKLHNITERIVTKSLIFQIQMLEMKSTNILRIPF